MPRELKRLWERHMAKNKPKVIAKSGVQKGSICLERKAHRPLRSDFPLAPVEQGDVESGISRTSILISVAGAPRQAERSPKAASCGSDCQQPQQVLIPTLSFLLKRPPPRSAVVSYQLFLHCPLSAIVWALKCMTSFKRVWQNVSSRFPPPPFGHLTLSLS